MSESRAKKVRIKEVDGWTLRMLIDYIYTAEIQVTEENVQVRVRIFSATNEMQCAESFIFVSVVQLQHGKSHLQTGIFSDLVLTKQVIILFKFWVKFKRIHVNEELVDFNGPCNQTLCNAIK